MAQAVTKPSDIDCPLVEWDELIKQAQPGDIVFIWSEDIIADIIEAVTDGPSHVMQLATFPYYNNQLYEFEAVFGFGVRLLPISHYSHHTGYRVLCSRYGITAEDIKAATGNALIMLGRQYEVAEELEIAAEKIAPWVKVGETDNRVFCSGLVQFNFANTSVAFEAYSGNATPVMLFNDSKTIVICKSKG